MRTLRITGAFLVVGCLLISCTRRNTVTIKQGNPQQFIISAQGLLDVFTVNGPTRSGGVDKYWVIAPLDPNFESALLTEPIVYGRVPPGFRQVTPLNGAAPPPITDGVSYNVQLDIRNGGQVHMLFNVQNGKITTEADAN